LEALLLLENEVPGSWRDQAGFPSHDEFLDQMLSLDKRVDSASALLSAIVETVEEKWEQAADSVLIYTQDLFSDYADRHDDLNRDFVTRRAAIASLQLALRDRSMTWNVADNPDMVRSKAPSSQVPSVLQGVDEKLALCRTLLNEHRPTLDTYSLARFDQITALGADDRDADNDFKQTEDHLLYLGGIFLPFFTFAGVLAFGSQLAARARFYWVFFSMAIPLPLATYVLMTANSMRRRTVAEYLLTQDLGYEDFRKCATLRNVERATMAKSNASAKGMRMGWWRSLFAVLGRKPKLPAEATKD
jgi:hypothetical protein